MGLSVKSNREDPPECAPVLGIPEASDGVGAGKALLIFFFFVNFKLSCQSIKGDHITIHECSVFFSQNKEASSLV